MDWIIDGLRWLKDHPEVTFSGIGTTLFVAACSWLYAHFYKTNAASIQQDANKWFVENRHKLLARLQWELGERNKSLLLGQTMLHLGKDVSPDEVHHPHTRQDSIDYTLERDGKVVETTDQPIVELFLRPDVGQRLAILGKPGSGKTVCLLKLLEHLLQQAEGDAHKPLPIIFECSEWNGRELVPWMAYQLHRKYEMQEDTARQMVRSRDILPLFDGLDELATEKQGDFVRCFNALPNDRPQIVCCRIKEYEYLQENAGDKLALRNAVILRDIAPQRLKGHLLRAGLNDLWTLLEQPDNEVDPSSPQPAEERQNGEQAQSLLELARRPLFLGIMIAVAEKLRQGWKRQQGESWEDLLWRLYLNDCLAQRPPQPNQEPDAHDRKYAKDKSLHWLHCLARWMQTKEKVALQIDELQPSMLNGYWRFGLSYGLVVGLAFGLMLGLFNGPVYGAAVGLVMWLLIGLPGCLPWQWAVRIMAGLAWGVCGWLTNGPVGGLFCVLLSMVIADNDRIMLEALRPLRFPASWQDVKIFSAKLARWLLFGLAFGLLLGLVIGFVQAGKIVHGPSLTFYSALVLALSLLPGLSEGLKAVAGPLNEMAHPQQRLHDALRSSLLLFPFFVLAAMLLFVQVLFSAERLGIAVGPFFAMRTLYIALFGAAILSFIALGTNEILQHYLLRLCLRLESQLPLRLVPWLEAMHQRKVLQRVGGSYHFLHKQLQEYLAKRTEAV